MELSGREKQIVDDRIGKIDKLRDEGIEPYVHKFDLDKKRVWSVDVKEKFSKLKKDGKSGKKVVVAGRVMMKRGFGKLSFFSLQDLKGDVQIVIQKGEVPESVVDMFKKIDIGDIVGVEGEVVKTRTGEVSVMAGKIFILTKAILPLPDKHKGLKNKEERYRKRYLDLIMNPEVKDVFVKRNEIIRSIRAFFEKKGYLEVDIPMLQPIYGGGSARPFETELNALKIKIYLSISTELYLKRLIVGGFDKVYAMNRVFRNEGIDATHNPEFTILETMLAYNDYTANMDLFEEMVEFVAKRVLGKTKINYQGKEIDLKRPWKRISMIDALKKYADLNVEEMSNDDLKNKLKEIGVDVPVFKRGIAIEEIFAEVVEEKLIQPTIVYDYPYESCGLAKPKKDNPKYAERFEPYINGWEMGNNYSELNDAMILEKYWKEQEKNSKLDLEAEKVDENFLNALRVGMPPTTGLGLGVDRLVMLLTNQPSIRDVILFPFMK